MKEMMLGVATDERKILLKFRKNAFKQVQLAKASDFDQLMYSVMNLAFWLRADLELLLRVAYWKDLSEKDFAARFAYDQINFYEVTLKKMAIDTAKTTALIKDLKKLANDKKVIPIKPESNEEIARKVKYRKDKLEKLFASFYKALSKFAHPDPYFISFPERHRDQIEKNLMNIFQMCKAQLDTEWSLLESHLKSP